MRRCVSNSTPKYSACSTYRAQLPVPVKDLRKNADSKVAPHHCRQARWQTSFVAFECLLPEAPLGVPRPSREGKTLKPARTDVVRSLREQEEHFFLTLAPLAGASLAHRYVFEPLISYVGALTSVLVARAHGKSSHHFE